MDIRTALTVGELGQLLDQSKLSSHFDTKNLEQNKAITLFAVLAYYALLDKLAQKTIEQTAEIERLNIKICQMQSIDKHHGYQPIKPAHDTLRTPPKKP